MFRLPYDGNREMGIDVKRLMQWLLPVALIAAASGAHAAPVDTVRVNLNPLIDAAAKQQNRFSVEVSHVVRLDRSGSWRQSGGTATWSYSVHIPTAVSLSFYANRISLPRGAALTVRGRNASYVYTARNLKRPFLWSRIALGDVLTFKLTVPVAQRSAAALEIRSFQAGYRGFGRGVRDHPHYAQLRARALVANNFSCVQNYECGVTSANSGPGQATVALIVENTYQCTGTLLNDVPADGTPFVLTARHCENGNAGGGNPGAAAAVTVFWNAVSPCGEALGSLYDPSNQAQFGATTVVEQQDAWLIQLLESPVVNDAYYAGFDASGGAIVGGYTIHHALSYYKQLTAWYGQALAVQKSAASLGVGYRSNFWEVVNQSGNIGPGASGSAIFDQNNRTVGVLTLGRTSSDPSGYGSCPVTPLVAPNGNNGVADFTSLAAVWNSTADTTSTTGTTTLQQVLDPGRTGTLVVAGMPTSARTIFTASQTYPSFGDTLVLSWSAPTANSCTASGGATGDNWNVAGVLPNGGTIAVVESGTTTVTYTYVITCSLANGTTSRAQLAITWLPPIPHVTRTVSPLYLWTTRPATFEWVSSAGPCALQGGSNTSLSNLPASGTAQVTESVPGAYLYTLTCGTGSRVASGDSQLVFSAPGVSLDVNGTDRIVGSSLVLEMSSYADTCTPTGGAPNDNWASTQIAYANYYNWSRVADVVGTYTYGVTCRSGPLSASASVKVTVENGAPYATLKASRTAVTNAESFTLSWKTNLDNCDALVDPQFDSVSGSGVWGSTPEGSVEEYPWHPGSYTFSFNCYMPGYTAAATPVTVTVTDAPPTSTLTANPTTITLGQTTTLTWSSTNSTGCSANGKSGLFDGDLGATAGSRVVTPTSTGLFTFSVICQRDFFQSGSAVAQVTVTEPKVASAPPPASGGGGGGAFGFESLGLLGLGLMRRRQRQLRDHTRTPH